MQRITLREAVFNRTQPLHNVIYRLSCYADDVLNPETLTADNFFVRDTVDGASTEISDVLYEPVSKEIALVITPEMVYNQYVIDISDDVKTVSGSSARASVTVDINAGYEIEIGGVGVEDISYYVDETKIFAPSGRMSPIAVVKLINSTPYEQSRHLTVYLNDDIENPIISSSITLKASSITESAFGLLERDYGFGNSVNISLK